MESAEKKKKKNERRRWIKENARKASECEGIYIRHWRVETTMKEGILIVDNAADNQNLIPVILMQIHIYSWLVSCSGEISFIRFFSLKSGFDFIFLQYPLYEQDFNNLLCLHSLCSHFCSNILFLLSRFVLLPRLLHHAAYHFMLPHDEIMLYSILLTLSVYLILIIGEHCGL